MSGINWIAKFCAMIGVCVTFTAQAQDFRALARLVEAGSFIKDAGEGIDVELAITQAVPYRIQTFSSPTRLAIDFREVSFGQGLAGLDRSEVVTELKAGKIAQGWSRLVLYLQEPMAVETAGMKTDPVDGSAVIRLGLVQTSPENFAKTVETTARLSEQLARTNPEVTPSDKERPIIVLDPGHGGVDPGAQRDGYDEADLMLIFARELREVLIRSGRYDVVLTRESDDFVSLPARVSIARAVEGDMFLSLHADALAKGRATGTTIYTMSEDASDEVSALLAERQDRQDIIAGVDLTAKDDEIARILIDLARQRTTPRTDLLADLLVEELRKSLGEMHKRPRLEASFSVLKAPDIPSVLIELGFMSSERDLQNLTKPEWRAEAARGILGAIDRWMIEDAARRQARQ